MSAPDPFAPLSAASAPAVSNRDARVRNAIAQAAERTGVDFSYLLAQAKLESSLNPDARARTSSATGLYQFIESTWLQTLDRHGASFGMSKAADAISMQGGRARVGHGATREAILAMRYNPEASAFMAAALAQDNSQVLQSVLGREPDSAELYLAHFLGAGGASNFLSRMAVNPDQSAAAIMPKAARANRAIFYQSSGAARSLNGVMELIRGKMAAAGADSSMASLDGAPIGGWSPIATNTPAQTPQPTANSRPGPQTPFVGLTGSRASLGLPTSGGARPSMASMLEQTFAATNGGDGRSMPSHVREAYAKLKAFDL